MDMPGLPAADPVLMGRPGARGPGGLGPDLAPNGRNGFGGQLPLDAMARPSREAVPLPPDASSTLYVEGLPSDSTKREVARILSMPAYEAVAIDFNGDSAILSLVCVCEYIP